MAQQVSCPVPLQDSDDAGDLSPSQLKETPRTLSFINNVQSAVAQIEDRLASSPSAHPPPPSRHELPHNPPGRDQSLIDRVQFLESSLSIQSPKSSQPTSLAHSVLEGAMNRDISGVSSGVVMSTTPPNAVSPSPSVNNSSTSQPERKLPSAPAPQAERSETKGPTTSIAPIVEQFETSVTPVFTKKQDAEIVTAPIAPIVEQFEVPSCDTDDINKDSVTDKTAGSIVPIVEHFETSTQPVRSEGDTNATATTGVGLNRLVTEKSETSSGSASVTSSTAGSSDANPEPKAKDFENHHEALDTNAKHTHDRGEVIDNTHKGTEANLKQNISLDQCDDTSTNRTEKESDTGVGQTTPKASDVTECPVTLSEGRKRSPRLRGPKKVRFALDHYDLEKTATTHIAGTASSYTDGQRDTSSERHSVSNTSSSIIKAPLTPSASPSTTVGNPEAIGLSSENEVNPSGEVPRIASANTSATENCGQPNDHLGKPVGLAEACEAKEDRISAEPQKFEDVQSEESASAMQKSRLHDGEKDDIAGSSNGDTTSTIYGEPFTQASQKEFQGKIEQESRELMAAKAMLARDRLAKLEQGSPVKRPHCGGSARRADAHDSSVRAGRSVPVSPTIRRPPTGPNSKKNTYSRTRLAGKSATHPISVILDASDGSGQQKFRSPSELRPIRFSPPSDEEPRLPRVAGLSSARSGSLTTPKSTPTLRARTALPRAKTFYATVPRSRSTYSSPISSHQMDAESSPVTPGSDEKDRGITRPPLRRTLSFAYPKRSDTSLSPLSRPVSSRSREEFEITRLSGLPGSGSKPSRGGRPRFTVPEPFALTGPELHEKTLKQIEEARRKAAEAESRRRVFKPTPMPDFSRPNPKPHFTK